MQSIYYSIEEIAEALKMRICCDPPGKYPLKQELVAITEAEAKLYQIPARERRSGSSPTTPEDCKRGKNC